MIEQNKISMLEKQDKKQTESLIKLTEEMVHMREYIADMKDDFNEKFDRIIQLIEASNAKFVTKDEFKPVRNLVYGVVGLALVGVFTAILSLVIQEG